MAESISVMPQELDSQPDEHREKIETTVEHLIEYIMSRVERPASREYARETREAFRAALKDLLQDLSVSHIEDVVEHLEERLKRGQHDLVVEFLSNLSKLQYADFAQEFLRLQAVPIAAQDDDIVQRDAPSLGHTAVSHLEATSIEE